jgi:DnaD/phage-associated family protein
MGKFKGFNDSESATALPDSLFGQLLSEISALDELKIVLIALWRIEHMDGPVRALRPDDFAAAELGLTTAETQSGLEKAVQRGVLLSTRDRAGVVYFLNSPRGRAAASAAASGTLGRAETSMTAPLGGPNVFRLYEENIGPLTPLIADALKDAEGDYPEDWITDAIHLAVTNNKRSWAYCQAILKRWKEEGRAEKQNRRDNQAARQRDVEQKIKKFIDG